MKTLNNSNLTLNQVLQSVVSQSVNDILIQEGIKSGDENPIKGLTDVKKKGAKGTVIEDGEAPDGYLAVRLDDGQVINVEVNRGWYRLDQSIGGNTFNSNQEVEIDYDPAGNAYIIASKQPITSVFITATDNLNLTCNYETGVFIDKNFVAIGKERGSEDGGGLILINDLTAKLNELVDAINKLATAFKSHTHNVTAVGAPSGPVTPPFIGTFNKFKKADYENVYITQYKNTGDSN